MKNLRFILFLAWRNCVRYRKRTLQSFLILFCGAVSIMLVDAYMKGYAASSMERVIETSGILDAHARGYLDSADAMPLDLSIDGADAVMDGMVRVAGESLSKGAVPLAVASIDTGCVLSNGEVSRAARVCATDAYARTSPGLKSPINPLLAKASKSIVDGRFFGDGSEAGAILDAKYAGKLGLKAGDALILLGNDAYGSFSIMESPILGIAREGTLPGEAGCVIDRASFSEPFGLAGKTTGISMWFAKDGGATLLGTDDETIAAAQVLRSLGEYPAIEARSFPQIASSYMAMFEFLDVFLFGMMAIFAIVAIVGMCNAILLSVQDRTKDIGTLRAIAITSRQAGLLIYAETLITGVAAAIAALAVGFATVHILAAGRIGIRFELSDMGSALPEMIVPGLFPVRLLAIAGLCAVLPVLAALLPARTARKLTVRECLLS